MIINEFFKFNHVFCKLMILKLYLIFLIVFIEANPDKCNLIK